RRAGVRGQSPGGTMRGDGDGGDVPGGSSENAGEGQVGPWPGALQGGQLATEVADGIGRTSLGAGPEIRRNEDCGPDNGEDHEHHDGQAPRPTFVSRGTVSRGGPTEGGWSGRLSLSYYGPQLLRQTQKC